MQRESSDDTMKASLPKVIVFTCPLLLAGTTGRNSSDQLNSSAPAVATNSSTAAKTEKNNRGLVRANDSSSRPMQFIGGDTAKFTKLDVNTACMLIGGVTFVFVLFGLVNYEDDDIRRYAWTLISLVGAIFVGVMIFSCANQWVLFYATGVIGLRLCAVQYLHLFVWICLLEFTLAFASGSIGEGDDHKLDMEHWVIADALRSDHSTHVCNSQGEYDETVVRNRTGTKSVMSLKGIEVPVEKKRIFHEQRHRRMKCWSTLLAHMCGFAALNAGGTMQHLDMFSSGPLMSLVPLVLNQLFINVLFVVFDTIRDALHARAQSEGRKGIRGAMYDEFATEAENDISCLAGSYILVQSIRYVQVGKLPTMIGELEDTPWSCVYALYGAGVLLVAISVILLVIRARLELDESSRCARFLKVLAGVLGFGFAWCCLFGSRTVFSKTPALDAHNVGMVTISGRVLLALILSLISTTLVFVLDIVSDTAKRGAPPGKNPGQEIVSQLVFAKSILIGFSWEHAFDGGVEAIASMTPYPLYTESALAIFMFLVVVPTWRRHILRRALLLQDYHAKQDKVDAQSGYRSVPSSPRAGYANTALSTEHDSTDMFQ